MNAIDGLTIGMEVIDTWIHLSIPVNGETLGQILNMVWESIDDLCPLDTRTTSPIHRFALS